MLKEFESAFKQLQFSILSSVFHQVILCIAQKKTIKTSATIPCWTICAIRALSNGGGGGPGAGADWPGNDAVNVAAGWIIDIPAGASAGCATIGERAG
jgi:hypothetical protein